ncbi:MAG TPA: ParA family protein [Acidimicrobiales bacterium]|nr:ParA family protein [Acidimicrobiales bacterium]
MKVVATYSIKGGVGKTASAVNLAFEAAGAGARVLVWDLDPQGAASFYFRVRAEVKGGSERLVAKPGDLGRHVRATDVPGLHLVPADFSLRHLDLHLDATKRPTERLSALLAPLAGSYDCALVDCPPSISLASESMFGAAGHLLVPVIPTTLSARTLEQLTGFLAGRPDPPRLLPHFSMVDRRKTLHREQMESLAASWPEFLTTVVPSSSAVERMGVERAPVALFARRTAAAQAYRELWAEVAGRLWPATG